MTDSPLLAFYTGAATDARGRRLDDILAWDDPALEAVHDYIQWLFPLPDRSAFNPNAPLLTAADIAAFRQGGGPRPAMLAALARMRRFFRLDGPGPFPWLTPGNHNMLRLTRILRSLTLLGLEHEAHALLASLEAVYEAGGAAAIGPVTLTFWRRAVQ